MRPNVFVVLVLSEAGLHSLLAMKPWVTHSTTLNLFPHEKNGGLMNEINASLRAICSILILGHCGLKFLSVTSIQFKNKSRIQALKYFTCCPAGVVQWLSVYP